MLPADSAPVRGSIGELEWRRQLHLQIPPSDVLLSSNVSLKENSEIQAFKRFCSKRGADTFGLADIERATEDMVSVNNLSYHF